MLQSLLLRPARLLGTLAMFLALTGCASLSPYSISESTLEGYLQNAVADFDRQQLQAGSPLSVSLGQTDITLGPDGREVAVLDIEGQISVNAFLTRIPINLALKVEGAPVYDREQKAVFIRRLKLLDSRVESSLFKGDLKPLTDSTMRVVAQWLETVPVYRLDDKSLGQRLLGMTPVGVKVAPGKLVLVPAE
ncbi:DUF1439 domain-containing protein [Marinobacter fonticola]|uniref:DUF1439 domain-containing protein n=1 Tax=Marinobacter fonticola TaxID=2603215 RepID=UPI0011E6C8A5|nr:DUF1439 domain-containing protein [Marinobacter fonticola]